MSKPITESQVPHLSEQEISLLANNLPVWIYVYDIVNHQSIYSNNQVISELGYTPDQIREMADDFLMTIMHPEDILNLENDIQRCIELKDGETAEFKVRFVSVSGEYHYFRHLVKVYRRNEAGMPIWVLGAATDISEQTLAEDNYRFQSGILQQVNDAIVAIDKDSNVVYWNSAAETFYGISSDNVLGKPLSTAYYFEWIAESDRENAETQLQKSGAWHGRNIHVLKNGERKYVESTVSLLHDAKGKPIGTIAAIRDITERQKLHDEVTQAQNLESLGLLAGGVSHEFNNILAAILGYAEVVLSKLPEGDPNRELLAQIIRSGERGASLTHQLLAFARRRDVEMKAIDVNEILRGSALMLGALLRADVQIVLELQPDLWHAMANAAHLEQVLINLALNSKDAMPNGGVLTIETKNITIEESQHPFPIDIPAGRFVLISVKDDGHGMEKTVKERAFEPFFTTKEVGKGTGLGLATSYGLIGQAKGFMFVESEPKKGATFHILLPMATVV